MFRNHIKIALRCILKARLQSLVNVVGLAIGMVTFMLIFQYVSFELSYDAFHEKANQLYRVKTNYIRNGELIYDSADNFAGVGPALKKELPEVIDFVRLYNAGAKFNCVITYVNQENEKRNINEKKLFFADESFFRIFSYPILAGEPTGVLALPNTAVLSESTARKYFGTDNAIGKVIRLRDDAGHDESFQITGVFEDVPNSHLKFNILLSYKTLHGRTRGVERYEYSWVGRDNFLTYIELLPDAMAETVELKLPQIIDKYKPSYTETGKDGKRIRANNFTLQPLGDIHLDSHLSNEAEVNGDRKTVYLLVVVAVFVLIVAWVNYVNLATAGIIGRTEEVGICKAIGASYWQLMWRFVTEAVILNGFALAIALGLFEIGLPYFELLAGKPLEIVDWQTSSLSWLLIIVLVLGVFLSALYPAFLASSFAPVGILSNEREPIKGVFIRKILVVFQFVVSISLASATIIVYLQLQFMRDHDLGFDPQQVLVLKKPARGDSDSQRGDYFSFKNSLLKYPSIGNVAGSNIIPGQRFMGGLAISGTREGTLDDVRSIYDFWTDGDFLKTYGLTLLAGRYFSSATAGGSADSLSIILSESAANQLGFANAMEAVGKDVFLFGSSRHTVIGVIEDYHHEQLERPKNPTMFKFSKREPEFISIKLESANLGQALESIEAEWRLHFPGNPFDFFFIDDFFNEQYVAHQQLGRVITLFSVLSLIIAGLGLLGSMSFAIFQRTKEIGIRKVLGANVIQILSLLSRDYLKLILIANLIAWPVAWYFMDKWLQDFAYRIEIGWWVFVLAGGLAVAMALLTVSTLAIRAAVANPVDSLRYE